MNKEKLTILSNRIYFNYFQNIALYDELEKEIHYNMLLRVMREYYSEVFAELGQIYYIVQELNWEQSVLHFYLSMDSTQPTYYLFTKIVEFGTDTMEGSPRKRVTYERRVDPPNPQ